MLSRKIHRDELPALLRLYAHLHPEDPAPAPADPVVQHHWMQILSAPNLHCFVVETKSRVVATCTLALIPNLTRNLRPYGVIENVVTDPAFRNKGFGTDVLRCALREAWRAGCYKVMLATGSRDEATLRFYERAGFQRGIKTGFIAYPSAAP
jgi:RimJ/RimL family protein N-acetyltransferase